MNRYERGRREFEGLLGSQPEESLAVLKARSPQLFDTLVEGGFGGVFTHRELGRRDRELTTVAMLATLGGAEAQLAVHAVAALRNGVTPTELLALCEHVTSYAGFPRGLNALAVIDQVLADAGHPKPARLRRVRLAGHETQVAERGDSGPAVVLLHGVGLDWRMWEPVLDRLAAGRRVFAYDLRGHGFALDAPAPSTMDELANDLIGVLDALGLDKAHVVGLSYGGVVAQTAAVSHPERFDSLSLLATTDKPVAAGEGRASAAETDGMAALVAPTLTRWFTPEALAVNGPGVRYARERLLQDEAAHWAAGWRALGRIDLHGKLGEFTAPTLVVSGEQDTSTPPELMTALADSIPGSVYLQLAGVSHLLTLEKPDLAAEALDKFLPSAN
jgi:3-oxoadipate enol-lactonase